MVKPLINFDILTDSRSSGQVSLSFTVNALMENAATPIILALSST